MGIVRILDGLPMIHAIASSLGVREHANRFLARRPLQYHVPGSNIAYRCGSLDSLVLADQIFGMKMYDKGINPSIRTFADLGCNAGYFIALLAARLGERDLWGIAVDASPDMLRETRWLIAANKLVGVTAVHGLVAAPGEKMEQDFFVNDCGLRSSRYPVDEPGLQVPGNWRKISVRSIDIELAWQAVVGDVSCDLLKIDIEGGEAAFLVQNNPFLKRVRTVLLEWHGWVLRYDEAMQRMEDLGFRLETTLERHPTRGTAYFVRKESP